MLIVDYSENHTKAINTLGQKNAEILIFKAGDTYRHQRVLKC